MYSRTVDPPIATAELGQWNTAFTAVERARAHLPPGIAGLVVEELAFHLQAPWMGVPTGMHVVIEELAEMSREAQR